MFFFFGSSLKIFCSGGSSLVVFCFVVSVVPTSEDGSHRRT